MLEAKRSHWEDYARRWDQIGPPLRPCAADTTYFSTVVDDHLASAGKREGIALILGVTPELATMRWPRHCRVVALDKSIGMILGVWPAHGAPARHVACGEWTRMPLASASVDVVLADGCFTQLPYPEGYRAVGDEIRRVLKPTGLFASRFFVRTVTETPEEVHRRMLDGVIASFHEFKFRLAMALQPNARDGVSIGAVWRHWNAAGHVAAALADRLGWTLDTIRSIEVYRDMDTRYSFPSVDEVRNTLAPTFVEQSCCALDYPFGNNCPILCLIPRG